MGHEGVAVAGEEVVGLVLKVACALLDGIIPRHRGPEFRMHVAMLALVLSEVGREAALLQEKFT